MFKLSRLSACVSIVLLPYVSSASADVFEVISVTAQKRVQSIQDVPVSVTAFSGEQMDDLGLTDNTEIIQQVPGLQVNTWSPNVTIFNLRGISQNNFQDNLEAPVAVYFDDAYMGSLNGLSGQLFDIQRTEILRGPQGTLFGRNATGGLIHYISQGADTDELNGHVKVGAASYNRRSVELAVGGGLGENVRGRFAGRWEEADGYVKALIPGAVDLGGVDGYALRTNIQVDFSDELTGDFWLKYSKDDNVPTGGYAFENCPLEANGVDCQVDDFGRSLKLPGTAAGDVHSHLSDQPGSLNRDTTIAQAKFTYDLGNNIEVVSITNSTVLNKDYIEDGDALPDTIVVLSTDTEYKQWSQEFRVSGLNDSVRWQTGFYYLDMEIIEENRILGAPPLFNVLAQGRVPGANMSGLDAGFPGNAFSGAQTLHDWALDSTNWSIFGQVEFDLTEDLIMTAGARWSQDDKKMDFTLGYSDDFNPTPILVDSDEEYEAALPNSTKVDDGDWAGRIALNYTAIDDVLLFASINRGIKGGNFTASIGDNITPENFKHDSEVLYAYEVGFKSSFPEYSMRLNATAFYYDYKNYQGFSLVGGAPLVKNTDAKDYGSEVELVWTPGDNWDFNFGLSYLETQADETAGPGKFGVPTPPLTDVEFPNAPRFSANYLARYNWTLADGNLALQVDGVWNDDQYLELTNGPGTFQEAYGVTNLRLTYASPEEKYKVSLFVKNVFDEEYKAYTLDLGSLGTTSFYAPPVTYGVNFTYNWW